MTPVVTRDYIVGVKAKNTVTYKPSKRSAPSVLRDSAGAEWGRTVTVRDAKAHLSALLEWVSAGHEVTITSSGRPKAKLVGTTAARPRRVFEGMGNYLMKQPIHGGPGAEEMIRAERDSRP